MMGLDLQNDPWSQFADLMLEHKQGEKDGACFVPGLLKGTRRKKAEIKEMSLAVWDIDAGYALKEIESACRKGARKTYLVPGAHPKEVDDAEIRRIPAK